MARSLLTEGAEFTVKESELELEIQPDPEATYTLRPITTDYARGVYRQYTTKVPNKRTHQMEDRVDQVAVSNALLDYCVTAWSGILDNGSPAPCTLEQKLRLPTVIQAALIDRAQIGASPDARAASFRESARVV